MWKPSLYATLILLAQGTLSAEQEAAAISSSETPVTAVAAEKTHSVKPFQAFTGKVIKNKVRLRTQPNLDGPIVREISRDDLFIVAGEVDDFYAVMPPESMKAYIFRTFVLEDKVEGSHVNVRLSPELESPVIAQLNTGDQIQGKISAQNSKWLEISPPSSTRFFIAKEYLQNVGGPDLMAKLEKRREAVNSMLTTAVERSQAELKKPFDQIQLDTVFASLNKVIQEYADFQEQASRAKELLTQINESYLQKKIAYLETKSKTSADVKELQDKLEEMQKQALVQKNISTQAPEQIQQAVIKAPVKISNWSAIENSLFASWMGQQPDESHTISDFYKDQQEYSVTLRGVVEPYQRQVKNKPGDFVLISSFNNLPVAYLYSTMINLQDYVGHEVALKVVERANNNFAYPAYFVLSVDN